MKSFTMKDCPSNLQIEALYDGELDPAQSAQVKAHLAVCAACLVIWNELAAMSGLFAATGAQELLPIAKARLHAAIDRGVQRGLVRIAWAMSALAACIVLAGSVWMVHVKDVPVQQAREVPKEAPPWVTVAATGNSDPVIQQDSTPAAQWYLADAGTKQDDIP
jgi:anti-sigma factor RsiW